MTLRCLPAVLMAQATVAGTKFCKYKHLN